MPCGLNGWEYPEHEHYCINCKFLKDFVIHDKKTVLICKQCESGECNYVPNKIK